MKYQIFVSDWHETVRISLEVVEYNRRNSFIALSSSGRIGAFEAFDVGSNPADATILRHSLTAEQHALNV